MKKQKTSAKGEITCALSKGVAISCPRTRFAAAGNRRVYETIKAALPLEDVPDYAFRNSKTSDKLADQNL